MCPSGTTQWGKVNDDIAGTGLVGQIHDVSIEQCRDRCKNDSRCGGFHWFPPNVCCLFFKLGTFFGSKLNVF